MTIGKRTSKCSASLCATIFRVCVCKCRKGLFCSVCVRRAGTIRQENSHQKSFIQFLCMIPFMTCDLVINKNIEEYIADFWNELY